MAPKERMLQFRIAPKERVLRYPHRGIAIPPTIWKIGSTFQWYRDIHFKYHDIHPSKKTPRLNIAQVHQSSKAHVVVNLATKIHKLLA
ncbi:hypothetical protein PVK06_011365 [Gossypium arboreum]|uniref:Uncharacterized protein n=1 Tax=Gossypium arboreum TaxID=29729 RepID=A0ABR0Q9J0_GOSAR|nr:hypothetical protein PVK06_011365 [Gossypium arboreum]